MIASFSCRQQLFRCQALFMVLAFSAFSSLYAQVFDIVVAKDGSGSFATIQSAIEKIPSNSAERTFIMIKNGLYQEKVWLYASKKNVSLIGESPDGVIISWDDYSGKTSGMNTADTYTFLAEGDDLYAENLTIRNTAGEVAQAVAVRTTGDRQVFKNCRFLGFQDTYYAHKKRQYNLNCYVEGATDFMFGDATAVFENCTIYCLAGGQYITAPNDTKFISTTSADEDFYHGLLFRNCLVTADPAVPESSYYLGRPWGAPASSVFINSTFGNHIREEGWSEWSGNNNHLSGTFAEYQNKDLSGELVNTSGRADWSRQLSAEEAEAYYNLSYFLEKDVVEWNPESLTEHLPAPDGLKMDTAYKLEWEAVAKAKGYVIIRNDSVVGFSATNSFEDATVAMGELNTYKLKSVTEMGGLSVASDELMVQPILTHLKSPVLPAFEVYVNEKQVFTSEPVDVAVYTLSGVIVKKELKTRQVSLQALGSGLYLIKLVNNKGDAVVKKISF